MKSKGFKIRSPASAINQRQGSLGVRLGLGIQNEPLKQQVQSPLFTERSRRMQGEERVEKRITECRTEPKIFYKIRLTFCLFVCQT